MKIPWKGLGILAVLLVAIVMNIPTVLQASTEEADPELRVERRRCS
jgi:hypothetical protein